MALFDNFDKKAAKKEYGSLGAEYLQKMRAYGAGMPYQLEWQQQYQPQYSKLDLQNTYDTLMGVDGTPGYLEQYRKFVLPEMIAAQSAERAAGAADLGKVGPQYLAALKASNPQVANLYDLLAQQASDGLNAGSQMTGDQFRSLNNSLRSSQGARGMAYGPAASYAEMLAGSQFGDQLLRQRQEFAGGTAELGNRLYSLPTLQLFGGTVATQQAQGFLGQGNSMSRIAGPTLFNTDDSSSLFNSLFNANQASQIASKNNDAALMGSLIGAGGSILGGGAAGAAAALV